MDTFMSLLAAYALGKVAEHEIIATAVLDLSLAVKVLVGFDYERFKEPTQHHSGGVIIGVMEAAIQFAANLFDVAPRVFPDRLRQIARSVIYCGLDTVQVRQPIANYLPRAGFQCEAALRF